MYASIGKRRATYRTSGCAHSIMDKVVHGGIGNALRCTLKASLICQCCVNVLMMIPLYTTLRCAHEPTRLVGPRRCGRSQVELCASWSVWPQFFWLSNSKMHTGGGGRVSSSSRVDGAPESNQRSISASKEQYIRLMRRQSSFSIIGHLLFDAHCAIYAQDWS